MGRRGRPQKVVATPETSTGNLNDDQQGNKDSTSETTMEHGKEKTVGAIAENQEIHETLEAEKGINEPRKLWVNVISRNRNPGNGLSLEFIAPKIVNGVPEVIIEEEDTINEVKFWETSLIMYVLGGELSMNGVKQFMTKQWNFIKLPDMYYNNEGYFILRFHSHKERDTVLLKGPYTIRNMLMLLAEWKPNFNLKTDMLRTIPVWVQFPQLPLHLWGKILGKASKCTRNPAND
ncbi:unnamed protein product [Lathyrus sativus]|nr:unnamed protein product [Lathyrus sativus]